jgi:hypothetical protein
MVIYDVISPLKIILIQTVEQQSTKGYVEQ